MKIAIISFGHEGSSLPLGKALSQSGHHVDFYFDLRFGSKNSIEGTDLQINSLKGLIGDVPSVMLCSLFTWIGEDNLHFKYVNTFGEAKSKRLLTPIFTFLRKKQLRSICRYLNRQNYDIVYLVGRYIETNDIITYCKYLLAKVVVGLHEVCNHLSPDFENPSPLLNYLFAHNIPIVVFSKNSLGYIAQYKACDIQRVYLIHFGTFDTFHTCNINNTLKLPQKYILYFGTINPYKGLPILVEAAEMMQSNYPAWKIVVAGHGSDNCLQRIINNDRFVLINRFLKNSEIAELLSKASVVVCPYITMSQSGIPQTAFAFGVPIIASDLAGFKEVISDGENGMLFETGNSASLFDCIYKFLNNNDKDDISKVEITKKVIKMQPEYSWNYIANQYIHLFLDL